MDTTNLISWLTFDESATEDFCGNTWTAYGNPTIGTTNTVNGNALQLDGSSYLKMDGGFALSGDDFTIHFWGSFSKGSGTSAANGALFFARDSQTGSYILLKRYGSNDYWHFQYFDGTKSVELNQKKCGYDTLKHFAIVYNSSTERLKIFCNGVNFFSDSRGVSVNIIGGTFFDEVYIGYNVIGGRTIKGSIDEVQIYDGVALWTEDFTPPTADFYSVSEVKFKPEVFMSWLPTGEINFKPEVFMSWIPHGEINFKPEIFATLIGEDIICEFNADLRRKLVNTNDFNADLKRTLVVSETFSADLRRSLTNKINFSFDLRRKIINRVEFSVDLKRTIIAPVDFKTDLRRSLANTVDLSADLRRKLVNRVEFSVDLKRTLIAPVEFTADLRRRVRASLTGGRMLSRVSPIYDASTFMQHFFNALGAEWEPIRQYFLTLREQKFIQTVDWGIEYLEHKYSIVPDKTLTLAERRARLGIKAFNKRPLNPAVLEKYARDVFGLEVYLDESDAGYIWIIATELTQIGYEGFMKFLVQEKPAHLALAFLLYFSEYIGYKIGDDLPKLHVGLVQVTSGVGKIKLPRPKNQHVDLYAGLAQITHGKATINLPRPKTQLINFSAGCALAVTGRIYIRSSYNALEAS